MSSLKSVLGLPLFYLQGRWERVEGREEVERLSKDTNPHPIRSAAASKGVGSLAKIRYTGNSYLVDLPSDLTKPVKKKPD